MKALPGTGSESPGASAISNSLTNAYETIIAAAKEYQVARQQYRSLPAYQDYHGRKVEFKKAYESCRGLDNVAKRALLENLYNIGGFNFESPIEAAGSYHYTLTLQKIVRMMAKMEVSSNQQIEENQEAEETEKVFNQKNFLDAAANLSTAFLAILKGTKAFPDGIYIEGKKKFNYVTYMDYKGELIYAITAKKDALFANHEEFSDAMQQSGIDDDVYNYVIKLLHFKNPDK